MALVIVIASPFFLISYEIHIEIQSSSLIGKGEVSRLSVVLTSHRLLP